MRSFKLLLCVIQYFPRVSPFLSTSSRSAWALIKLLSLTLNLEAEGWGRWGGKEAAIGQNFQDTEK